MNHIQRLTGSPRAMLTLAAALTLYACAAQPVRTAAPAAAPNEATYTTASGERVCVTVSTIATGPGSVPWAWATINADPRRVVHVVAADLTPGCAP